MRIIEPHEFRTVTYRGHRRTVRRLLWPWILVATILVVAGLGIFLYQRSLPQPTVQIVQPQYSKKTPDISWPIQGQAAIGAVGYGVLAQSDNVKPTPTASVAKVITAMAVLDRKPLAIGEQGPAIVFSEADVEIYNKYVAKGGSVVPVNVGASLTEYQALQALLLPSANNIAETLTNWAFGSQTAYTKFANTYVLTLGMNATKVDDASGFSPATVSTPGDLVKLGIAALNNQVVAEIVRQPSAELPGIGTIYSTNKLLNQNGVVGIKTGNTDEAGGCYLVASTAEYVGGQKVTVVAAVLAAPALIDAMNAAKPLLTTAKEGFGDTIVVTKGQQFGTIRTDWQSQTAVTAQNDISLFGWQSGQPEIKIDIQGGSFEKGSRVGTAQVTFGQQSAKVDLVQDQALSTPSVWWRLFRR